MAYSASAQSRSHLFSSTITLHPFSAAMAATRSMRNGSVLGMAPEAMTTSWSMLAAAGLKASWVYKKVQVLAIFDDLDTILLMIPLQIMMIGLRWQLGVIILVVVLLLILGWKKMGYYNVRQDWKAILFYAVVTFGITQVIYLVSKHMYGEEASIHIEVLLPAFVVGMIMRHKHIDTKIEHQVSDFISYLFMFLVGVSMPVFMGVDSFFENLC